LLHKGGLLAEVDAGGLAAVCASFGLWMDAERRFSKIRHMDPVFGGLVVKSSKGTMIPNPLLQVATKARNDYVRLCTEFGLTPASRARIAGIEPPEDADPAERFWND
jgi:P27 family predicted phage terminase small subunit